MAETKKLYRSRSDRIIAGVAGGLGEYFNVDPLVFRILFVILFLGGGTGLLLYLILVLLVPNSPEEPPRSGGLAENGARPEADRKTNSDRINQQRNLIGLLIIVFGVLLLVGQIMPVLNWFRWNLIWPVLIILLGIALIAGRLRGSKD